MIRKLHENFPMDGMFVRPGAASYMGEKEVEEMTRRLLEFFPIENTPVGEPMLWSNHPDEESVEMTRVFEGKKWNELEPKDFGYATGDMAFLREPWHFYYLPALMRCSMVEVCSYGYLKDTDLAVRFEINRLDSYTYPQSEAQSNIRKILSVKQVLTLLDWIYIIAYHTDNDDIADHLIVCLEEYLDRNNPTILAVES